ncbi:histidine phosphatase superfamily [Ephemerocybe angulata]|uniref:Histidine phosphatase superfamily n=1 Tax=Ephemerocybe angulata TaxID=980116 RepID=A0A8H6I7V7_9AGAR|nr:histidine phosphatase superfamily [Tulosesus angulatus]
MHNIQENLAPSSHFSISLPWHVFRILLIFLGAHMANASSCDSGSCPWDAGVTETPPDPILPILPPVGRLRLGDGLQPSPYTALAAPREADDWCNMPHVTLEAYITPPEEYVLRYVEVIQRHHKRTPYGSNLFYDEDVEWDCAGLGPLYGLKSQTTKGREAPSVQWQSYVDPQNPFGSGQKGTIVTSNCQFPQLTTEGLEDSITHGSDLRSVYGPLLGISDTFQPQEVVFRVTNNPITSQVASGILKGFYPTDTGETHQVLIQPSAIDSLEPRYSCPRADALRNSFTTGTNGTTWKKHLQKAHDDGTFGALDAISGIRPDDGEWHVSFDHYFDNLKARQCHSKPLPCSLTIKSSCVTEQLADKVYEIGNWEYSYLFRDAPGALEYAALKFGAWMLELEARVKDTVTGNNKTKYYQNIAHDGSISSLLGFLQVSAMTWPGMGSEIIFELYSKAGSTDSWFLRVLWKGRPIET